MPIRSLTAPSISEAMRQARSTWGDGVVLLESVPPNQGQHARITVMVDDAPVKVHAGGNEWMVSDELPAPKTVRPQAIRVMPELRRPGALFARGPDQETAQDLPRAHFPVLSGRESTTELLPFEHILPRLTGRSSADEQSLTSLSSGGFRGETARELIDAANSIDRPFPEALQAALVARLPGSAPVRTSVFCTADTRECATSFTLRLASHWLSDTGRALPPLVVVVPPSNAVSVGWLDPSPLYRAMGLPVQFCRDTDDVQSIEKRSRRYEGLLVDAGTASMEKSTLGKSVRDAQHIHILDASRRQAPRRLRCDSVAFMNLPGNWMAAAQTLLDVNRPVSAIVHGPAIAKGLKAYRSADFATATLAGVTW